MAHDFSCIYSGWLLKHFIRSLVTKVFSGPTVQLIDCSDDFYFCDIIELHRFWEVLPEQSISVLILSSPAVKIKGVLVDALYGTGDLRTQEPVPSLVCHARAAQAAGEAGSARMELVP